MRAFCRAYLRTLDADRAAAEAGGGDGFTLLRRPAVRRRLETMRAAADAEILREDAVRRLCQLAFGQANDAVALALRPPELRGDTAGLDLGAVSECKVTDKGVEIKFIDRVRALEVLCGLLDGRSGAAGADEFFRALEDAGACGS